MQLTQQEARITQLQADVARQNKLLSRGLAAQSNEVGFPDTQATAEARLRLREQEKEALQEDLKVGGCDLFY